MHEESMARVEAALEAIREGRMVVVADDESRENEGDLVMAAAFATPESINFMVSRGRGLVCVAMKAARLGELGLRQMESANSDPHGTAFTVSVDAVATGTGISAADRASTARVLASPGSAGRDLRSPGHLFPLAARAGGVLERRGHTEAAVDLVRLALPDPALGTAHAGLICEILRDDGAMARGDDLTRFAAEHGLPFLSVFDIARYRQARERLVERVTETILPTDFGDFRLYGYRETITGTEHVALAMGNVADGEPVLARVHSECLTGDALGSRRCDCGEQYEIALRAIADEKRGVLVYLRQEGRGIGLVNKLRAYELQDRGLDTVDANLRLGFRADERDYHAGAQILRDLGVGPVRLMTNNPAKISGLSSFGIEVMERVPIIVKSNERNERYLRTKEERMEHIHDNRRAI